MSNTAIMTTINTALNKASFQLKKHSPEILMVAGVIGTIASAVMACKATTKLSDILEDSKEQIDTIHECTEKFADEKTIEVDENGEEIQVAKYSPEDAKKALTIVYTQTGVKLIKLYAPAVALGVLSLTGLVSSNMILRKRNIALAAAYAMLNKDFKGYRNNVLKKFGAEVDRELKYGLKATKIEEAVVDEETGKEKKIKKTVNVVDSSIDGCSQYARFFAQGEAKSWEEDPEYNQMFLRAAQNYFNDLLRIKKHVFLNEVYDYLGIERTQAGQIVGWIYDANNRDHTGDNYINFNIQDVWRELGENGYEKVILLDFNVDGPIYDNFVK